MNTFTIDAANNITAFASLDQARAAKIHHAEYFGSAQELVKLAGSWPANRGVEIWNSFAGVAPFTSLKPEAIHEPQGSGRAHLESGPSVISERCATGGPRRAHEGEAGQAPKAKRRHTPRCVAKDAARVAREGSKKAEVIDLMRPSPGTGNRSNGQSNLAGLRTEAPANLRENILRSQMLTRTGRRCDTV
jgi:hypothetical protein